ncbi:GDP-mannose 4,6-dehydratase [Undibacterium sp.]|jgi:nucleoside-diphosphate-sugar epimerase|uniref:GDP-mannose 4,6-dehydratase n=1 Tax=Undibacterium sp. TaxID=1914977 RepID=UPI002BD387BE|nr:GDP-mannose 4,6-dehydratase [Undibacterium sp.]HTD06464.1 GDP-mannose 4,6-dehydratase [Undibacterium sp.]
MRSEQTRPRALITGLHGFTGRYLAQELGAAGYQVYGTAHGQESSGQGVYTVDLGDRQRLQQVVAEVQPHVVAHLAAISFVAHGDAAAIYRTNVVGTRNLLEALATLATPPEAVLVASSANIYGNTRTEVISEMEPAQPANDYGISKLAMEHVARLWMDRLPIIVTRPFNYTGVGQAENFLLPKIISHYRQRAGLIELGNLDVARDFSDVRTVVQAYTRLLQRAPAGQTFNICSGRPHTLHQILDMVAELAGYKMEVRINPAFVRANEVKTLTGDPDKLRACIGELPQISLRDTLAWMLDAGAKGELN